MPPEGLLYRSMGLRLMTSAATPGETIVGLVR